VTNADRPAFAEGLYLLTETFNEPMSELRTEMYFFALMELRIEVVMAVMLTAIRVHKFVPRPAELRSLALGDSEARANAAWAEVSREIQRVGYLGTPRLTDPHALDTIRGLWGSWQRMCQTLPGDGPELVGWIKQFTAFRLSLERRANQGQLSAGMPSGIREALTEIARAKTMTGTAERRRLRDS